MMMMSEGHTQRRAICIAYTDTRTSEGHTQPDTGMQTQGRLRGRHTDRQRRAFCIGYADTGMSEGGAQTEMGILYWVYFTVTLCVCGVGGGGGGGVEWGVSVCFRT